MNILRKKIPKEYPKYKDYEIDLILNNSEGELFEEKPISDNTKISFVLTGNNGVYLFLVSKTNDENELLQDIGKAKLLYSLPSNGIFSFIRTDKKDFYTTGSKLYEIEEIEKRFACLYENNSRPLIDYQYINFKTELDKLYEPELPDEYRDDNGEPIEVDYTGDAVYVAPLISKPILEIISQKFAETEYIEKSDVYYDENGQKYRKFPVKTKIFSYSYDDQWYPIATDNSELFAIKTVFGGWFGLHKFITGEYLQGILYLITCGGFGIFYLFDVLMILLGNYSIDRVDYTEDCRGNLVKTKTKIYLDKIINLKFMLIMAACSMAISFISTKFIYLNILGNMNNAFANSIVNTIGSI